MQKKRIILLGATGSIGTSTLDVISTFPDRFSLVGLSAHSNLEQLKTIARKFPTARTALSGLGDTPLEGIDLVASDAAVRLVEETEADMVVNGIMGAAGLAPSAAAVAAGLDLALANKETIVMAGDLLLPEAKRKGVAILPVDSEHAAIFQLLRMRPAAEIAELILTASGGPFRQTPLAQLKNVGVEAALAHPTWSMGAKISIDSATMANKGLEVIEAERFFDIPAARIRVLIHPPSVVHSLVRAIDGAFYAQLSSPDMRNPIVNALSYPETIESNFAPLDLAGTSLSFSNPERERYPLLWSAFDASRRGGAYPIAFNAANEVAVDAFIQERVHYPRIAALVSETLQADWARGAESLADVMEIDRRVRRYTIDLL